MCLWYCTNESSETRIYCCPPGASRRYVRIRFDDLTQHTEIIFSCVKFRSKGEVLFLAALCDWRVFLHFKNLKRSASCFELCVKQSVAGVQHDLYGMYRPRAGASIPAAHVITIKQVRKKFHCAFLCLDDELCRAFSLDDEMNCVLGLVGCEGDLAAGTCQVYLQNPWIVCLQRQSPVVRKHCCILCLGLTGETSETDNFQCLRRSHKNHQHQSLWRVTFRLPNVRTFWSCSFANDLNRGKSCLCVISGHFLFSTGEGVFGAHAM